MADHTVETAADLEAAKQKLADAEAAHTKALVDADENRSPEQLVHDLLEAIVMRLGNRPEMRHMVMALEKHMEPAPAPEDRNLRLAPFDKQPAV
jgi:hypothetical protein